MAAKTYIPTLLKILDRACKFIMRYETQIKTHLSAPQAALLDNVVTACKAFTAAYGALTIGD